jgi:hypothetical protein
MGQISMDMKRHFEEAIALGEANVPVLELARNFCEHLQVETLARGELEAATNLPIGMRMFDCEYATGNRIGAMDLRHVAVSFYDNNCKGCDRRKPQGFPNLLDLVRERDEELARAEEAREQHTSAQRQALETRRHARSLARVGLTATTAGLLDRIGELDDENSAEAASVVVEIARTVPAEFTEPLRAALRDLTKAEGEHRVLGSLRALDTLRADDADLVSLALDALHRNIGAIAAAEILATRDAELADSDAVEAALPALIHAAIPLRDFQQPEPVRSRSAATALVRLYRLFPGRTSRVLRHLLNDDRKESRIRAAHAAEIIIDQEPQFGLDIAGELIRSMSLPDDHYGPVGSAAHAANDALRTAMRHRPAQIDELIQRARSSGSAPESILDVYTDILRPDRATEQLRESRELRQHAFGRLLDAMISPRSDEEFIEARELLGYAAEKNTDLLVEAVPRLLGTIALLLARREELDASPITSPLFIAAPSNPFAAMEMDTRKSWLNRTINELCELVAHTIGLDRTRTIGAVIEMLEHLQDTQTRLRAKLVRILGEAAKDRDVLPVVLPILYRAMTDVDVIVRMEAAEAYRHVAGDSPDDLPSLFHETFLCMLLDPYVAVHDAALESLTQVDLPAQYREQATAIAWHLIQVHRSGKHADTLVTALRAFCATNVTADPRWKAGLPQVVAIVRTLSTFDKHTAVQRLRWRLSGVEGFVDLLVDLLEDPRLDFARHEMLENLQREPRAAVARVAQRLNKAAEPDLQQEFRIRHPYEHDPVDLFTSLLADAGAWAEAEDVAHRCVEYQRQARKSDGMRRLGRAREIAVGFTQAVAEQRSDDAERLATTWAELVGDSQELVEFEAWFAARVDASLQLAKCAAGQGDEKRLETTSTRLTAAAAEIGDTKAGTEYRRLASVLRALAFLVAYLDALRRAEPDGERFVKAARRLGKELQDELVDAADDDPLRAAALLLTVANEDSIAKVAEAAQRAPIGLPFLPSFRYPDRPLVYRAEKAEDVEVTVAFTSFRIGGRPVRENEPVEPRLVHDVEVDVVVSRWPPTAGRLMLDVTTVELTETFKLPPFVFDRPARDLPRYTLTGRRKLLLKEAQALGTLALEFQYRARFEHMEGLKVSIEGQRTLKLRSYDPDKTPETGSPDADRKLLEIADVARQYPGVSDAELGHFLRIMSRAAALAFQSLQDNRFPREWAEPDFQAEAVQFLRDDPRIGSKLQQHAQTAAGETDLTFFEMPIELKVETEGYPTCETVIAYADQAIQYAVGNSRRFAILVVLDTTAKASAPMLVANDMVPQAKRNGESIHFPVLLGTVIIRGNLPLPSSHSRRKRRVTKTSQSK